MPEEEKKPKGFQQAYKKAEKLSDDDSAFQQLLSSAKKKTESYKGRLKEVWHELEVFYRMLRSWKAGEFKMETKTILSLLAAVIYFVNPFDIVPDFIPALGLIDDISIITYVIHRFENEIEKFKNWEDSSNSDNNE